MLISELPFDDENTFGRCRCREIVRLAAVLIECNGINGYIGTCLFYISGTLFRRDPGCQIQESDNYRSRQGALMASARSTLKQSALKPALVLGAVTL